MPLVRTELESRGASWRWLRLGLEVDAYRFDGDLTSMSMEVDGQLFKANDKLESRVIYLPFRVDRPPSVTAPKTNFASREWESAVQSFLGYMERQSNYPWLIDPRAIDLQDRKLYLLAMAITVCETLRVPLTRVTSRLSEAPDESTEYVLKAVSMWQQIDAGRYFNTTRASKSLLSTMIGTNLASPVILQERIPHYKEIRLYYSFGSICAVELEAETDGLEDFRLLSKQPGSKARLMERRELVLVEIDADIRAIAASLGISYFSADIGVNADGYWLFDINPIGSWEYLRDEFDVDVSPIVISSYMEATKSD